MTMLRYLAAFLLPALVFLLSPAPAGAQWPRPRPVPARGPRMSDDLSGRYDNVSGGGECDVYRRGRGYVFINEHGSRAYFVPSGPGQFRMVSGEWDASTRVTVSGDRYGRTVLRFTTWSERPGFWVSSD
jgi:hypothetical protein